MDNMIKPTLVFVPGFFTPHPAGTTVGADSNVTSHHEDTAAIRKVLSQLIVEERKDIILVMHSYGGVAGSEAVRGLEKSVRGKETVGACGVIHCVYITAILVPTGMSALGLLGGNLLDAMIRDPKDDRFLLPNDPATAFYNDVLSTSIQHEWINRLKPTPYAVLASEVEYNCCEAETVPCSYLTGEKDNVVPPAFAKAMIESVLKDGRIVTEVVCGSGHSPWLTRVEDVVKMIRKAGDEEVEVSAAKVDDKGAE